MLVPRFVQELLAPEIQRVFIAGCGGGFDFVHGLLLVPMLLRAHKEVVIGSYSFGRPEEIAGARPVELTGDVQVRLVTAQNKGPDHYAPEVHVASYLDACYPQQAPHEIYAYYARDFSPSTLTELYSHIAHEHDVDAVVLMDGGTDSLMVGDEEGLGDPIEDATSVACVDALEGPRLKLLLSVGLGADRFNQVSDASSLRAIAELTAQGGFRGAVALEPDTEPLSFYRAALEHIYAHQSFRSVLAACVLAAADGCFGSDVVPQGQEHRMQPGEFFLWPLMATIFAFDVEVLARRSKIVDWIRGAESPAAAAEAVHRARAELTLRPVEALPVHEHFRWRRGRLF